MCLHKFIISSSITYNIYLDNFIVCINNNLSLDNELYIDNNIYYQGYYYPQSNILYNDNNILQSRLKTLSYIQILKEDDIYLRDTLISIDENNIPFISKFIGIYENNDVRLLTSQTQNIIFFYNNDEYIYSCIVDNNDIILTQTPNFPYDKIRLNGIITGESPQIGEKVAVKSREAPAINNINYNGDLYLNITNNEHNFYQFNNTWYPLYINAKYIEFTNNNQLFSIEISINNKVKITNIKKLQYNGYYSGILNIQNPNYYYILLNSKYGICPELGDYLLLNNNNIVKLFKYSDNTGIDNENFREVETDIIFLFYSNNGDFNENIQNKILLINNNIITLSTLNDFDQNNSLFIGGAGVSLSMAQNLEGKYYLLTDKILDKDILKISYDLEGITYLSLFTCSQKIYYNTNDIIDDYQDRYCVNFYNDLINKVTKINFAESEYTSYQGFYSETTEHIHGLNTDIINKIKELKLGRNVINGDFLFTNYNNGGYNNYYYYDGIINISISLTYVYIYYDIGNLQILKIYYNEGYYLISIYLNFFDQYEKIQGHIDSKNPIYNKYTNDKYYCSLSLLYNIFINISNNNEYAIWVRLLIVLSKFIYKNLNNNNNLIVYLQYNYFNYIFLNYEHNNVNLYQGYYYGVYIYNTNDLQSKLDIIYFLQKSKKNYINIGDSLSNNTNLLKIIDIDIINNNIAYTFNDINNYTLLLYNDTNDKIISYLMNNYNIQILRSFSSDVKKLKGIISSKSPFEIYGNFNDGDFYLNITESVQNLYQYGYSSWHPLIPNIKYIEFTNNNESLLYSVETSLNNLVTVTNITPTPSEKEIKPFYQGYYDDSELDDIDIDYIVNKIKSLSGLKYVYIGDSLLVKISNIMTIYTLNYVDNPLYQQNSSGNNPLYESKISDVNPLYESNVLTSENILYYNNNINNNSILVANKNNVSIIENGNDNKFNNTNTTLKGYVGYGDPKINNPKFNDFYMDLNTNTLYKFIKVIHEQRRNELTYSLIPDNLSNYVWIKTITSLYNPTILDLNTNNKINININPITNSTSIFDISGYNQMYNGGYQAYYSNNTNITTQEEIFRELSKIKNSKVNIGDFILLKVSNNFTIYRVNVLQPLNIKPINKPENDFMYYNAGENQILLISDGSVINYKSFDPKITNFNGYMEQIPPIPIPDINKLFNLYLPTNTFSQYNTNNNTWYQTFLGLYKYTFDRNPHYDITITYIDGSQQIISLMQNNSAFIENKIIFDNVVEFNDDLDNLYILTPSIGDKLYLNNQQGRGIIIEYIEYNNINNPLDPNNGDLLWMYYSPSTIMAIKFENETKYKYVYNAFDENYFLTSDSNFSGKIITDTNILSLEIEPDNIEYKFGDLILLMDGINNGNIYELTYSSEFETPYVFKLLTNQQSYFKANDKIYTVNVNGVDKYIVEKPDTNYFVGKIITQNIIDYEDGEYYSLNITSPFTINDRVYNLKIIY